jgi:hypothetical protein
MRGRLRTLAALLALFALSAYFAESVMASWCMPGAETSASADGSAPGAHAGMHHGVPQGGSPEAEYPDSEAPPCPFGMTGAGASCVAAPLPATSEPVRAVPIAQASLLLLLVQSPDLLLVTAHFRPPRA